MSTIDIKIVEVVDEQTLLVKFASENSAKSIDEYDAVAFQIGNYPSVTSAAEFVEAIKGQVSFYVATRDSAESVAANIDISNWEGFVASVESVDLVAPSTVTQLVIPAEVEVLL